MIEIKGTWYDGQTSNGTIAVLRVHNNSSWQVISINDQQIIQHGHDFKASVSARLANTPRYINFNGDETLETKDNNGVDEALRLLQGGHWSLKVHMLESKLRYVLIALVFFIFAGFVTTKFGIPAATNLIVNHIPKHGLHQLGKQTLTVFDELFLEPSELSPSRENELRHKFQPLITEHPGLELNIIFRKGGEIGANAFALPGGQIIITDEMIDLMVNDHELLAIVVHEIGHIKYNHGVRRLIQNSIFSFALFSITGDVSGVSEIFLGLPVIITELGYSRRFEVEADIYALEYLRDHSIAPQHFANILVRASSTGLEDGEKSEHLSVNKWSNYFSTHPATEDRVKMILSQSEIQ